MLGKLLKYDMAALSRILVPIHVIAVVLGLAASALFYGAQFSETFPYFPSNGLDSTLFVMMAMTGAFCLFGMMLAPVATIVAVAYRYYTNLFTDEGYLTLTLPVSATAQVASKVIAAIIWVCIDAAVVVACGYLASIAAIGFATDFSETLPYYMFMMSNGFVDIESIAAGILGWANAGLSAVTTVLTVYAAFSLGSALSARHKVATGVALSIALWAAAGLFQSIKSVFVLFGYAYTSSMSDEATQIMSISVSIVFSLIVAIAFFALCVYVLDRKTNLA